MVAPLRASPGRARPVSLAAAVLAAWALRLHDLGRQSLWYDEGTSVTVAPRTFGTILANAAADIHPPLYYLMLHLWAPFGGLSEWGARFPSAAVGTLTVALLYRLGRDAFDGRVGLVAALLLAGAPLPIWYSQEARMYALATGLGVAATALLVRALICPSRRRWAVYAATVAATLYSHYFAAAVPLAHAVGMVAWTARRPRDRLHRALAWSVAVGTAGILFVPWVWRTAGQLTGWPATAQPYGLADLAGRTLGLFAFGQGGERAALTATAPLAAAGLVGLVLVVRRGPVGWLLATYALVPLAAMFAVSLRRPFFHPKFVVLVAPAVDLLAAVGVVALGMLVARRSARAGVITTTLLLVGLSLWRWPGVAAQWNDPRLARDDYRGLAADIGAQAQPGDAVVLNAPGQIELFNYYFRGEIARYPLPETRPIDEAATALALEAITDRHPRVWLALWAVPESDPTGFVERFFDEHMYKTTNQWYGGVRLAQYVNPRLSNLPTTHLTPRARFGDLAELATVDLLALQLRAGDVVPVTLGWKPLKAADRRYTVFVHVVGAGDYLWGQRDAEPVAGNRPTTSWRAGETVVDRQGVPVLPGTPPGEYSLEVGLYDANDGRRLPVTAADGRPLGDRLLLGPFAVQPGRVGAEPKPTHRLTATAGNERLLGFDLHPLGRDEAPPELGRGEVGLLTLYWRGGERAAAPPAALALRLERGGAAPVERLFELTQGRYPADHWTPGELIRDPYKLATDDLTPGTYQLGLQPRDERGRALAVGDRSGWIALGSLVVR